MAIRLVLVLVAFAGLGACGVDGEPQPAPQVVAERPAGGKY